jgi:hypothetical protein
MTNRLTPEEAAAAFASATPIPTGRGPRMVRTTFHGVDAGGTAVSVRITGPTVVVALSTTCDGCRDLAEVVRGGVEGFEVLGVLRPPRESVTSTDVAVFVGSTGHWVIGDDAFEALDITSAPFFCVLDASGACQVEGVALGRAHVEEHLVRVLAGTPKPDSVRLASSPP